MARNLMPLMADAQTRRKYIREKTLDGLKDIFPLVGRASTLELKNLAIGEKEYSSLDQKEALMRGRTLHEPVTGTLVLRDNKTGTILDEKKHTLMHLPYFTERHTFIVGGNEYDIPNQLRLKPGVYTRERGNGEFEAAFNLSKGDNFRLSMEPESGKLHMELGTSKIQLYPLLRSLGVPDQDISKYWGKALRDVNATHDEKEETVLNKVIGKIIKKDQTTPATIEGKRDFVRDYFDNTAMDPMVNERTLGVSLDKASPLALLHASKKLIDVHKKTATEDDRDSLEFKTIHSVDDFFKERMVKDAKRTIGRKLSGKMNQASRVTIDEIVPPSAFTKSINTFITTSSLSSIPSQISPIEIIDHAARVTSLGEGGIGNERAIPFESRKVHNTHLGVLDPTRTPETFHAGIDVRATIAAFKDDHGNLYTLLRDHKTGKLVHVPTTETAKSVVAFPGQDKSHTHWDAVKGVDVVSVPHGEVDYEVPDPTYMFSPATNLVPLINGSQGNRIIMGSKFQTQALPLATREAPLVQTAAPRGQDSSMEKEMAKIISPTARHNGVITKIDEHYIYMRPDGAKVAAEDVVKLRYDTFFPLASKTYLHNDVTVKVGDRVKKDQVLAKSNFTTDDTLALGKNLKVAYMGYYGKNSNDAIVISESAAKKLTSEHMYKEVLQRGPDVIINKGKVTAYFGMKYTKEQLDKLDENGIAKPGVTLHFNDPIILGLRKSSPTPEALLLGNLHKSLVKPYSDATVTWDHPSDGTVQDVMDSARQVMVTVRSSEVMKIGDKMSNRFGGKGVVSEIIPDERFIHDESGDPVDVIFTSAGVVSRINPAQIIEAALGKVAEKTGKPIILPQFLPQDNVQFAKDMLKKHGVKDKETVYDPISDKHIPGVFVGRSYIHKLFKSTDTNYSARGVSDYDVNLQPTKGGDEGAKGLGKMEMNALLAHNARNILKEAVTVKGEKSDEFWRAYEMGLPPPAAKAPFVADKLISMLKGAGINVNKEENTLKLGPMTNAEVTKLSSGALSVPSLEKSKSFMVSAKNMQPEKGGLFDPVLTGGLGGTRWSHIDLHEAIVNPVFDEPVRRLLGLTNKELYDRMASKGGAGIRKELNAIDLDAKEKEMLALTKRQNGAELDDAIKQLKYVRALKEAGLTKAGDAYVLDKIPVIPPVMRPILPSKRNNEIQVSDINYLYRDLGLASEALKNVKDAGLPEATGDARKHLHDTAGALFGIMEPTSPQLQGRQAKGFIEQITGSGSPKQGFFHKKILKRQQDLSGRATIAPDVTLGMDQIGLPEDMVWKMYSKFIMKNLVGQGHKPLTASEMVEDRHPLAKTILDAEVIKRPVLINRAPTLHKHNIIAAYPILVEGKTIRLPSLIEKGFNADFDGDTFQVLTPVTDKAVAEAQNMVASKILFSDKNRNELMNLPQHESIMGLFEATRDDKSKKVHAFKNKAAAMEAYRAGDIQMHSLVDIGKAK